LTSPHLLRVDAGPERFAALIDAARALDLRVGWLELAPPPTAPGDLETAAGLGTLRAVAAGGGRAMAVKPLKGEPVLKDLLREHFRGCALVLIRGEAAAPLLQSPGETDERWTVTLPGEAARAFATAGLAEALRSPRPPWAPPLPPRPPREQKKKRVKKTKQEKKRERIEKRKKGKPSE
jgi:hypothetical protein